MEQIIAVNYYRVGKFLGIKLESDIDLLKSEDIKIKQFVRKYSQYLSSNKIEKIKEFYSLTGLMITHIFEDKESNKRTIYSMNNIFREDTIIKNFLKPVYTTHILVISKYDNNTSDYFRSIYEKNQNELLIGNSIRYTLSCVCRNVKSRVKTIENEFDKNAFENINKNDIKDVFLTPLNNLCILLKNGDFYLDKKLYAKKVDCIWHQDSYNVYLIYSNNSVEHLTCEFPYSNIIKYKKVVYNSYMLAVLKKKVATLTILVDKPDTCVITSVLDVDDISISKNMLYITVKDRKIRIPSWYNTIVVSNKNN